MKILYQDEQNLDNLLSSTQEIGLSFLKRLSDRALQVPESSYPEDLPLPEQADGAEAVLALYQTYIEPYVSSSVGPRYFGFVTGGATPASLLGDWLSSVIDQNAASRGDSISAKIEEQVIMQLRALFGLPDCFSGSITTGATVSNLLGLLVARQFVGHQQGIDVAQQGMQGLDVEVFSACPHASTVKSMGFAGLGRNQITFVDCLPNSEKMDVADLSRAMAASKGQGKIVIASAATVSANDFDDLQAVAEICRQYGACLHVDAAFGLFAALLPEKKAWLKGIELADSICSDAHKWLNVPYESGIFFTRHMELLKETACVSAPYLNTQSQYKSYPDYGLENSRRFRALPIWFSLQAYGRRGYQQLVEQNCQQALQLGRWIEVSDCYELLRPVKLNVVLFRARPNACGDLDLNELNKQRLNAINETAKVLLTPGVWQDKRAMRAAFSNWRTKESDVKVLIEVLHMTAQACR